MKMDSGTFFFFFCSITKKKKHFFFSQPRAAPLCRREAGSGLNSNVCRRRLEFQIPDAGGPGPTVKAAGLEPGAPEEPPGKYQVRESAGSWAATGSSLFISTEGKSHDWLSTRVHFRANFKKKKRKRSLTSQRLCHMRVIMQLV